MDACRRADRLVCVSDFVRHSVLRHGDVAPERVLTIHSTVLRPLDAPAGPSPVDRPYLLYPANVWPHKNHARLLDAFGMFLRSHPESELALVCTGAPSAAAVELAARAQRALPADRFAFLGFVDDATFAALLHHCRALIFPSLYEGFGLPVLEAMALGKPVLCSKVTSLPEIAGDAALLFDPYDPAAIALALERLVRDRRLEASLVERGRARAAAFGTPSEWAARYLAAFEEAVRSRASAAAGVPSR
jgi:glycosyltransferase involved in cell wall biosynthesis